MPKYMIERSVPGAGSLSVSELREITRQSCNILEGMGPDIQWVHSYVTGDKLYCVYVAPDEEAVREHARQGNFPVDRVSQITITIDPSLAQE